MQLAVRGGEGLREGRDACLSALLLVRTGVLLCLCRSVRESEGPVVAAAPLEPVHARRARFWQLEGLDAFEALEGVIASLGSAALGVGASTEAERVLADGDRRRRQARGRRGFTVMVLLLLDAGAASHFGGYTLQGAEDLPLKDRLLRLLLLQADLLLRQHLHRQTQTADLAAQRLNLVLQPDSSRNLLGRLLRTRTPFALAGGLRARPHL